MARSPVDPSAGATAGNVFGPSQFVTDPTQCAEGIMGNDEVSPTTHHIFVIHDDAVFHSVSMGRCVAVTFTTDPSGLQCTDHLISNFGPNFRTGGSFPTMAVDKAGNLYAVWEQAPVNADNQITGDTVLKWSFSSDEGNHWTTPVTIPTPGLHNNVMAWPAAGDAGRVDIAWYGTPAVAGAPVNDPNCNNMLGAIKSGPDNTNGLWSLYFTQTLNGTAATPTFSAPVVASQHFIHRGSIQTVMGGQCGDRTLGDFLQIRTGLKGEANISYSDSNNIDEAFAPHAMFVRQIAGSSLFTATPTVSGTKAPINTVTDTAGDARYEAATQTSANQENLDILSSSITKPDATHYSITMKVADLTSLAPDPTTGNTDTTLIWQTQWLTPSTTAATGGSNFMVYMESQNGAAPTFWVGQNAVEVLGGGVTTTYPGDHNVPGTYTPTAPGTITITVPTSDVNVAGALDSTLHQVTTSTQTLTGSAATPPSSGGIGGNPFNLIDVAPGFDFVPSSGGGGGTPACTIKGTAGNDTLNGTPGNDVICGLGGNDTIDGKGGNDFITGDKGMDTIIGGPGSDTLKGGYGNDTLHAKDSTTGNDKMDGGRGTDTCTGDAGDTKVDCEA
jgi:Ca2+-binding RTX toxin-like protein